MSEPNTLTDINAVELDSPVLIEASAGTGKTYTIEKLFIRVLEENPSLQIEDILVVTFTKAAAAELRTRLHAKLLEVQKKAGNDPITKRRWEDDLLAFDQASITTIHGFCERVLSEFAFEGRLPFDAKLADKGDDRIVDEMVFDFWRSEMYSGKIPDELMREAGLFNHTQIKELTNKSLSKPLAHIAENADPRKTIKAVEAMRAEFLEKDYQENGDVGIKNFKNQIADFIALRDLFNDPAWDQMLEDIKILRVKENSDALRGSKAQNPPRIVEELRDIVSGYVPLETRMMLAAQQKLAVADGCGVTKVARLRRGEGARVFDDTLNDVRIMLETNKDAVQALRARFKVAMIDEFQDTDPVQWKIFKTIFMDGPPPNRIMLVGDPKQAIYSFRGGDINTYLAARGEIERFKSGHKCGLVYTLRRNYRSEPAAVEAVNNVFETGKGKKKKAFNVSGDAHGIEYPRIQDKTTDESIKKVHILQRADDAPLADPTLKDGAGLVVKDLSEKGNANENKDMRGDDLVGTIRDLVSPGKWKICTYVRGVDEKWKREKSRDVVPGDILVLSFTKDDMAGNHRKLSRAGIPCTMSSEDSVFGEEEANWMRCLLDVALSSARRGFGELLATPLFGFTAEEIMRHVSPDAVSDIADMIRVAADVWRKHGLQSFISEVVRKCRIRERLLAGSIGERHWTNFSQIVEILGRVENEKHLSPEAVRDWLVDAVEGRSESSEEHEFRLESDAAAVTAMTIHKSKGLEAPIVFVTGISSGTRRKTWKGVKEVVNTFHDADGNTLLSVYENDQETANANTEALEEAVRLFYVALTRAKNRTYYYMDKKSGKSYSEVLAHLLETSPALEEGSTGVKKSGLVGREAWGAGAWSDTRVAKLEAPPAVKPEASPWATASFSALKARLSLAEETERGGAVVSDAGYPAGDEPAAAIDSEAVASVEAAYGALPLRYTMRGGPVFGNALHEVFEVCPFDAGEDEIRELVLKGFVRQGLYAIAEDEDKVDAAAEIVGDTFAAEIPDACGGVFTLASVGKSRRCSELSFHFPMREGATLDGLVEVLRGWGGIYAKMFEGGRSPASSVAGMMTGIVDLFFEHGGKYYIADWKTNIMDGVPESFHIDPADPLSSRIAEELAASLYPLQWAIYTVAMHRHLRNTLPGYDYAKHFGGIRYLFVRGITKERPGDGTWIQQPPPLDDLNALDVFFDRTSVGQCAKPLRHRLDCNVG